ncbi:CD1375 family protein [Aedoeadaptatus coxii]|nr:CD1375 family protein [Peptoniphilus coxii]
MVKIYVSLIMMGLKTVDEVPAIIRDQVKKALEDAKA